MTVEQLHDALTLLPADLVAEADKRRSRSSHHRPNVIRWQRLAAMAACLVLVMFAGRFCMAVFGPKGKSAAMVEMAAAPEAVMQDTALADIPAEMGEEAPAARDPGYGDTENTGAASKSTADLGTPRLPSGVLGTIWVETPVPPAASVSGAPVVRALVTSRETLDSFMENTLWNMEALREAAALWDEGWFESHDVLLVALAGTEGNVDLNIQEEKGQWTVYVPEPAPDEDTKFYHILIITEKELIPSAEAVTAAYQ